MMVEAFQIIPKRFINLWEEWNLRIAVLISLSLQFILIFTTSLRKRSGNVFINSIIWSSYLLADWFAAFAVGLISSSQGEKCDKATIDDALSAFWAPFLLLHLGGPDTITAFSLEDNELWLRHMLSVTVQVIAVGYVFLQSLPNRFWIPTGLMFLAGTIKYAERTRSLYLACLSNLKDSLRQEPDPGPNYAQLMEEYSSNQAAGLPEVIDRVPEPDQRSAGGTNSDSAERGKTELEDIQKIEYAYTFYKTFRGLIVDHMFSFHERNESRKFFFSRNAKQAFGFMEVELNFMYDALYTKMATVYNGIFGGILRFVCSGLLVISLVIFASSHQKQKPHIDPFDKATTYLLLVLIFSDWSIALMKHSKRLSRIRPFLWKLNIPSFVLAVQKRISLPKRWSNHIYQHNLISYCLKKRWKLGDEIAEFFGVKELVHKLLYPTKQNLDEGLKEFIFNDKFAKDIYSARGDWTILDYDGCSSIVERSVSEDVEYDESVLIKISRIHRIRSKILSDYLMYLLIMQPKLMLSVSGIAQIRFQDTCEEARKFFSRSWVKLTEKSASEKLIKVDTPVNPIEVKGDRSKSLLFDAVILAKDLKEMVDKHPEETWEMMSKVWLELLCYGASHCRGDGHAQQIRQGGELITLFGSLCHILGWENSLGLKQAMPEQNSCVEK
ncbi:hypothetical protein M9H77_00113 [Catharanthus roseus]|nr:hypothetical protein M9H77_00113 [Catharanthus roseus]